MMEAALTHYMRQVEGASHYDLYDQPEPVTIAVEKLTSFYNENL